MRTLAICLLFKLQFIAAASEERMKWFEERRGWIERARETKDETTILNLSRILSGIGRNLSSASPEGKELYEQAKAILISIPGHATYYRDKINALREQMKSGEIDLDTWSDKKWPYFEVLGHMPSEEAVEVLGAFAADKYAWTGSGNPKDWDVPGLKEYRAKDWVVEFSVCVPACKALENLGIENPPVRKGERVKETKRQELWSQWWSEVKTGKRTYRFKGSDVVHPVSRTVSSATNDQRPERRPTTIDKQTAPPPAGSTGTYKWIWPTLILALLVGGYLTCRRSLN
jgi:hypothetical protein